MIIKKIIIIIENFLYNTIFNQLKKIIYKKIKRIIFNNKIQIPLNKIKIPYNKLTIKTK